MKNKRILLFINTVVVTVSLFMGCNTEKQKSRDIELGVVATVGNDRITKEDLENDFFIKLFIDPIKEKYGETWQNQFDEETKKNYKQMLLLQLNNLIEDKVLSTIAINSKLMLDEELEQMVHERIESNINLLGGEESFNEYKKKRNYTDESYKIMLEKSILASKMREEIRRNIKITDDDIKNYYDTKKNEDSLLFATHAQIRAIKFSKSILEFQNKEILAEAENAYKRIADRQISFDDLFHRYKNREEGTNLAIEDYPKAEDLGDISYDSQLEVKFMDAVLSLKQGEVSNLIEISDGYYILQATSIREKVVEPLDDKLKTAIRRTIIIQKQAEKVEEYKKQLNVKVYENQIGN